MAEFLAELLIVVFNSILFQRQLFQRAAFKPAKKWGVPLMICSLPEVQSYLKAVVSDINRHWLKERSDALQQVMLTIVDEDAKPIERWQFSFQYGEFPENEDQLRCDLRKMLRQVYSTSTFLPLLRGEFTFRVAVTDQGSESASGWSSVEPTSIQGIEGEFQSLQMSFCRVQPQVIYTI